MILQGLIVNVHIPPASGERIISVLIEAEPGQRAGLGGVVSLK